MSEPGSSPDPYPIFLDVWIQIFLKDRNRISSTRIRNPEFNICMSSTLHVLQQLNDVNFLFSIIWAERFIVKPEPFFAN